MTSTRSFKDNLVIFSSWSLECEQKDLKRTVTFNNSSKSVDLEDVVQVDSCVHLIRSEEANNDNSPCTITMRVPEPSTFAISQLLIVSEARIVEVFGSCDEYLTTCSGEYIDDFEDCAVYMSDCSIKPSKQVLIKFQKTKHVDSLWVYGINLRLSQNKCTLPAFSSINFQSVNEILKEAKAPLSENAEKCKAFLQTYGGQFDQAQAHYKSKTLNPQILMKMLETGYLNPLGETGKNVSKCISNFVPFLAKDVIESKEMPEPALSKNSNEQSSEVLLLKNYIDQRFTELECKIDQKISELEVKQNKKLDYIIDLLNKSNQ